MGSPIAPRRVTQRPVGIISKTIQDMKFGRNRLIIRSRFLVGRVARQVPEAVSLGYAGFVLKNALTQGLSNRPEALGQRLRRQIERIGYLEMPAPGDRRAAWLDEEVHKRLEQEAMRLMGARTAVLVTGIAGVVVTSGVSLIPAVLTGTRGVCGSGKLDRQNTRVLYGAIRHAERKARLFRKLAANTPQ